MNEKNALWSAGILRVNNLRFALNELEGRLNNIPTPENAELRMYDNGIRLRVEYKYGHTRFQFEIYCNPVPKHDGTTSKTVGYLVSRTLSLLFSSGLQILRCYTEECRSELQLFTKFILVQEE